MEKTVCDPARPLYDRAVLRRLVTEARLRAVLERRADRPADEPAPENA